MDNMESNSAVSFKKWRLRWILSSGYVLRIWSRLSSELFTVPLDPILHPSSGRLWWLGLFTVVGHPLFYWIWGSLLPQPYENVLLRGSISLLGIALMVPRICTDPTSKTTRQVFTAVFWLQLPLFFSWMYLCNGGNTVWLASECAMILIYYHVTDWRIATLGTISGGIMAWWCAQLLDPGLPAMSDNATAVNTVVIAFCWSSSLLLGLSSANLRREHLRHALTTMGIMAHELRTPLATMSLIGDALRAESHRDPDHASSQKVGKLAQRMHVLVRHMNHQIDTQISNASLLSLPANSEHLSARELARDVIENYPYRGSRERDCIRLMVRRDFIFDSSAHQFSQVLENLLKNALHSLAAAGKSLVAGDVVIEIGVLHGRGRIQVSDQGGGIEADFVDRVFEPFFSTDRRTGHGLGLAFCKRVVNAAGGSIRVKSELGRGAIFTIELPIRG